MLKKPRKKKTPKLSFILSYNSLCKYLFLMDTKLHFPTTYSFFCRVIFIQEKPKPPETTYLIPIGNAQTKPPPGQQIILLDSPAKTAMNNIDHGCDLLQACAAACGIDENEKIKQDNSPNNNSKTPIKNINASQPEDLDLNDCPIPPTPEYQSIDILNTPESSPEKSILKPPENVRLKNLFFLLVLFIISVILKISPVKSVNKAKEDFEKLATGDDTNLGMTLSSDSSDEDESREESSVIENQEAKLDEEEDEEDEEEEEEEQDDDEEEKPFLLNVASLLVGDRTPTKNGLKSFSPKKNLSPAKVMAKRLTDKAKRKLLSIEKKDVKESLGEKTEEKDCEDVENIDPKEIILR